MERRPKDTGETGLRTAHRFFAQLSLRVASRCTCKLRNAVSYPETRIYHSCTTFFMVEQSKHRQRRFGRIPLNCIPAVHEDGQLRLIIPLLDTEDERGVNIDPYGRWPVRPFMVPMLQAYRPSTKRGEKFFIHLTIIHSISISHGTSHLETVCTEVKQTNTTAMYFRYAFGERCLTPLTAELPSTDKSIGSNKTERNLKHWEKGVRKEWKEQGFEGTVTGEARHDKEPSKICRQI